MADTIKCPNCGSNLTLNADTQKLECPSCGASFDPAELNTITVGELPNRLILPKNMSRRRRLRQRRSSLRLNSSRHRPSPNRLNSYATHAARRS